MSDSMAEIELRAGLYLSAAKLVRKSKRRNSKKDQDVSFEEALSLAVWMSGGLDQEKPEKQPFGFFIGGSELESELVDDSDEEFEDGEDDDE